ncbi:MsnO8 family LLM class oxidoreductase [Actinoplanes sp. TBRC 11911]|uniref:MsnO8 family LLM class oxidoreductase n=1 Tax=Actinoplanes sp. TBRC 11911 TaxID=2729386 RepID=UPI00145C8FA5|nr:MsnO8 family LLM class oxidoreductase [Actinoplanes sp. TBRC 11911]NMO55390.1 MsnO8 family LLM class oxidoreductase [Actinoplanes sp. TBRC 11911]
MMDFPVSVLELLSTDTAHPAVDAHGFVDVAQAADRAGYHRIWYTEHHGELSFIAFPPAVVIARVASVTTSIRVGSGGVLAVNHAPLSLAEQFEALTSFFPGRIDLGIGRGPGAPEEVARALRRRRDPATEEEYHASVAEILRLTANHQYAAQPWLLASSPAGAALAARLGLPMAFAHHLRPQNATAAVDRYRTEFRPSPWNDAPRLMLAVHAIGADSDAEAEVLAGPANVIRARLATNQPSIGVLGIDDAAKYEFSAEERQVVAAFRKHSAQGTPEVVRTRLVELAGRFGADEIMIHSPIIDPGMRVHSYELIMGG